VDSADDRDVLLELLRRSALFATMPDGARNELAAKFERFEVATGDSVVREGDAPDAYYLIAEGTAEAWELRRGEPDNGAQFDASRHTLLSRMGPGDAFGEMALLQGGRRTASVRAASPLVLYRLDGEALKDTVGRHRELALALEQEMMLHSVTSSLGRSSPFARLPPESIHWLALRLQQLSFEAGATIIRQGDIGDAFYIVF
jgi:ATP-binding cassette subfamily B protein